jgi:hypothetical protein
VSHTDVICADRMGANKQPRFALGTLPGVYEGMDPPMSNIVHFPPPSAKSAGGDA